MSLSDLSIHFDKSAFLFVSFNQFKKGESDSSYPVLLFISHLPPQIRKMNLRKAIDYLRIHTLTDSRLGVFHNKSLEGDLQTYLRRGEQLLSVGRSFLPYTKEKLVVQWIDCLESFWIEMTLIRGQLPGIHIYKKRLITHFRLRQVSSLFESSIDRSIFNKTLTLDVLYHSQVKYPFLILDEQFPLKPLLNRVSLLRKTFNLSSRSWRFQGKRYWKIILKKGIEEQIFLNLYSRKRLLNELRSRCFEAFLYSNN